MVALFTPTPTNSTPQLLEEIVWAIVQGDLMQARDQVEATLNRLREAARKGLRCGAAAASLENATTNLNALINGPIPRGYDPQFWALEDIRRAKKEIETSGERTLWIRHPGR